MMNRETRKKVLLAAAVAHVVKQRAALEGDRLASPWARTYYPDLRATAWNPRRGQAGWRLDGRLRQHNATPISK